MVVEDRGTNGEGGTGGAVKLSHVSVPVMSDTSMMVEVMLDQDMSSGGVLTDIERAGGVAKARAISEGVSVRNSSTV